MVVVIATLPEGYESKISSLEYLQDLSTTSVSKLINALYAQEQRRENKEEGHTEGAFQGRNKKVASSVERSQRKTVERKNIHHDHTAKSWVTLRNSIGSDLMPNAKIASSLAMKKGYARIRGTYNNKTLRHKLQKQVKKN
ncbi:pleiotropic drug resistance protein 3-like [Gossypium australe]|uniref:Pleiotropic drug resistance protein 3-like n=1 Tax=Gossypium australe TaxID=47621 RepID=A0A5B6U6B0_9ROSI|nr:pleiotropic drug resistance protein 3-like [Gossypium australe]